MLQSVRGTFRDGAAHPVIPVEGRDVQQAIITFLPPVEGPAMLPAVYCWFRDGQAVPTEAVEGHEGQEVLITFIEDRLSHPEMSDEEREAGWQELDELIDSFPVDVDLPKDLAHQHDHYLYGTPKKPDPYLQDLPEKENPNP